MEELIELNALLHKFGYEDLDDDGYISKKYLNGNIQIDVFGLNPESDEYDLFFEVTIFIKKPEKDSYYGIQNLDLDIEDLEEFVKKAHEYFTYLEQCSLKYE